MLQQEIYLFIQVKRLDQRLDAMRARILKLWWMGGEGGR